MKNSKYFRGYEPAQYSSVNNFTSKETKEAFNWGYEAGLDPTGGDGKYVELDGSKDGGSNLWPDEKLLPGFYEGIAEYYGKVFLYGTFLDWMVLTVGGLDYTTLQTSLPSLRTLPCPSRRLF